MGKRIKLREARRHEKVRAVRAVLESHSKRDATPRTVASFADFDAAYRDRIEAYRALALQPPESWRCRIKSRSPERRFLDLVKFAFARYPIAAHLEDAWFCEFDDDLVDRATPLADTRRRHPGADLRRWYIIVAQGGSLHRQAAHQIMSKLETHHFLNTPADVTSSPRAFWYAFARAQTDQQQVALRIAQTKLVDFSVASTYWKDAVRFFVRNPVSVREMDDLIDFIRHARWQDKAFTLKGRTLPALRRRMEEWHRALRKQQAISGGAWAGRAIPDVDYQTGSEHRRALWHFRQIKTGNALFKEGQRMHHCVASYKWACMNGDTSIWSLTSEFPIGQVHRGVTTEVRKDGRIVQCRGFANRLPHPNEVTMVKRWAQEFGLTWNALERC